MKAFLLCVVLFLIVPMAVLNPLGRDAFLGYYAGIVATWAACIVAMRTEQISQRAPN